MEELRGNGNDCIRVDSSVKEEDLLVDKVSKLTCNTPCRFSDASRAERVLGMGSRLVDGSKPSEVQGEGARYADLEQGDVG